MNFWETPKSHNLGPQCRLAPVTQPFSPSEADGIPPIKAQYFYASPIPIDDPLSTSTFTATADSKPSRANLQPFSQGDNNTLERAWLGLASAQYHRNHSHARRSRSPSLSLAKANADKLTDIVRDLALKHAGKHTREGQPREMMQPSIDPVDPVSAPDTTVSLCCRDLLPDVSIALQTSFCAVARRNQKALDREKVAQDVMTEIAALRADSAAYGTGTGTGTGTSTGTGRENRPSSMSFDNPSSLSFGKRDSVDGIGSRDSAVKSRSQIHSHGSLAETGEDAPTFHRSSLPSAGISGMPFVRVGTPESPAFPPSPSLPRAATPTLNSKTTRLSTVEEKHNNVSGSHRNSLPARENGSSHNSVDVPVGVSRLHKVSLPDLQMKPIYWSPVNDIVTVLRGTWFYK